MSEGEDDGVGSRAFGGDGAFGGGAAFNGSQDDTCIEETFARHSGDGDQDNGLHAEDADAAAGATGPVIPDSFLPLAPAPHNTAPRLPGFSAITMGTTGQRAPHNRLKPLYARVFPNLHRVYDDMSRAIAHIAWPFASAQEIWAICNANLLASGAGKQQTMAHFKNHACKTLHDALTRTKDQQVRSIIAFIWL